MLSIDYQPLIPEAPYIYNSTYSAESAHSSRCSAHSWHVLAPVLDKMGGLLHPDSGASGSSKWSYADVRGEVSRWISVLSLFQLPYYSSLSSLKRG